MTIAQCRKALVAFAAAFLSAFAPMWAQRSGWPGWDAAGGCAIFAALSALAVWAVPNARPPTPYEAVPGSPVATMAARSAARTKP